MQRLNQVFTGAKAASKRFTQTRLCSTQAQAKIGPKTLVFSESYGRAASTSRIGVHRMSG